MAFIKKIETNFSFADLSLFSSLERNRAIKRMQQINAIVDWSKIENLLLRNYPVGKSTEGNEAYPPLILMKCLLLQQWFRIDSDPALETQINDRSSFKTFLGLSFDQPSPDHSTFSRFRSRFSKDTIRMINYELLSQFASRGLAINEGVAIDARLVKSAIHLQSPVHPGAIFRNLPSPQRCLSGQVHQDGQKYHRHPVPADGLQSPPRNQGDQTSIGRGGYEMTREQ